MEFVTLSFLVFAFADSPVLAYVLAVLVSRRFESRKLTAAIVVWTLLYPLFFIIGFVSFSLSWVYFEDLAHNYPANIDLLGAFSNVFRTVFLAGLNVVNASFVAILAVGLVIFISEEKRRNNKADTSVSRV